MTRDEIMNMEAGRKLDALAAERVMEWTWVDGRGTAGPSYWEGASGEFMVDFQPSTDIAAAWQVLEKIHSWVGTDKDDLKGKNWVNAFHYELLRLEWYMAITKTAEAAAAIICRAALLAVTDTGEDDD